MILRRLPTASLLLFLGLLTGSATAQTVPWKGKIVHNFTDEVRQYDFGGKTDKTLFQKAKQPYQTKEGDIYYVNDAFPKGRALIRRSNSTVTQFRDVLDMSAENPAYKQALADYSVIKGTGISAVLDRLEDPKVSPDGKYLAVTVFGYPSQAFPSNRVVVFDRISSQVVTQFEDKYYGSWLPDGRLLLCGSHKSGSTDGSLYQSKQPGIFLTDAALANPKRIDPELDDPAPYHAVASPDGKRVTFVMNNHVWVMNLDGSGLKQLTAVDRDNIETYPAWSPDGKYVACWTYKTFERSYYTALAVVPAAAAAPMALTDKAAVWPRDTKNYRISGGAGQFSWR